MGSAVGVLNLLVGGLWAAAALWLVGAWPVAGVLAALVALAQVLGGAALLLGRGHRPARLASALTLVVAALLIGLYAHATYEIASRFGAEARDVALTGLGSAAGALPWLVFFPLWQVFSSRERGLPSGISTLGVALLAGGLAFGGRAMASRPAERWAAQPALEEAGRVAFARWTGADPTAALPEGAGPALVLLTPWIEGEPGGSVRGEGPSLGAALSAALDRLPPPASATRRALVLDLARERWDEATPLGPDAGALLERGGRSPSALWRPRSVERAALFPGIFGPRAEAEGDPARFDSVLVDESGPRSLVFGWTEAPALSAEAVREAALAGGRMLARHQDEQGRYAYTIAGPSGRELGGYNFPRHAGVTWYLARLVERSGDPGLRAATERGLGYLEKTSTESPVGGAYVRDPERSDRKVWVGTTALAALAAVSAGHPMALPWGRFVAASVDEEGQVRGDMDLDQGGFPAQPRNAYGQGQAMLALAALVRAGHAEFEAPLRRAQRYVDGAYARGGAGRLIVLDEHWACLAALAGREATGETAGWEICRAYVHDAWSSTPTPGAAVHLSTGAAGGLAEAVVAAAWLDPDGPWTARALDFARLFLESAYKPGDAPLLGRPEALLGGFRDTAGDWDVRMDAVQHIGCALLGVEALLDARAPGSLP